MLSSSAPSLNSLIFYLNEREWAFLQASTQEVETWTLVGDILFILRYLSIFIIDLRYISGDACWDITERLSALTLVLGLYSFLFIPMVELGMVCGITNGKG